MKNKIAVALLAGLFSMGASAQVEIQWWHSMTSVNGEWVNDLAKEFNASQNKYKVTPIYKGSYDESMTAAIAAYRAGNAPHILQVFEVGTAMMMASGKAIKPVGEVMKEAGQKFDAPLGGRHIFVQIRIRHRDEKTVQRVFFKI